MINKIKSLTNTEDKKRLLSNFFSLSLLQAFTYILPLLTLPYLVKVLGVEKFGLVMFAQSFIMFFNILVDYGFNLSVTREISIHRDDKAKITEIFSSIIMIKFILIGISFTILSLVIFSFDKFSNDWVLYYLTFIAVIGQALFPVWYFQGLEQMKYISIINIISRLIFTVLIFVFIQNQNDYIYVPLLNGLGFIIGGIISLYIIFYNFNQSIDFKILELKKHLQNGFHVFLSISSSTILSATPVLLIGTFLDYAMAGYYSAFEKLISAIKSFFYIVNQTFFPRLSKIYTDNKEKYILVWKKLSMLTIGCSMFLYVILYFTSNFFINYIFGNNFINQMYIFYILSLSIISYTIINSLGLNGLLVIGQHKQLSLSQIVPVLVFVLIAPFILKFIGFTPFLFLILLVDIAIILIRLYFLRRIFNGKS